ncbi:MAG TPA: ROK family protein [Tepidisphaeraceae bacterium]|nr:ROK family protein [Tepidisphaeraceae bacterium]
MQHDTHRPVEPMGERERQFASLIWRRGPIGRREIHQLTRVHPTLTGQAVASLIDRGLVRDAAPPPTTDRGRPQVPVEIDSASRTFLGLSIAPGVVRLARVNARGVACGSEHVERVTRDSRLIQTAATVLRAQVDPSVFSIGISFTGVVDPQARALLFSSSLRSSATTVPLDPLYDAAGDTPIVLHNDMHALALRWLLTHGGPSGDVLLVGLDDGRLGASLLIDGKPHRGSVSAANELGHTRLAVATDRCYCGQEGCLERIVSTRQLARFGAKSDRRLSEVLAAPKLDRAAMDHVLDHLVTGLANAVNFIRPKTLVISSPLARYEVLVYVLRRELPPRILPGLRQQVSIEFADQFDFQSAENAAWLALADVFGGNATESEEPS